MHDDILNSLGETLEKKVNRRSFLRGSGLAAVAFVGMAAASSLTGYAQEPAKPQDDKKKTDDDKDKKKDPDEDKAKDSTEPADGEKTDTKIDADGREYRECPQCGSNMYRQGRTWTCENCGYSYIE
jgi:ribosomal protein S27AE